jgi:hypothetical protein
MIKTRLAKVSAIALLAVVLLGADGTTAAAASGQGAPKSHTVHALADGTGPSPDNTVWE